MGTDMKDEKVAKINGETNGFLKTTCPYCESSFAFEHPVDPTLRKPEMMREEDIQALLVPHLSVFEKQASFGEIAMVQTALEARDLQWQAMKQPKVLDIDYLCYLMTEIRFAKTDDDAQKVIDRVRSDLREHGYVDVKSTPNDASGLLTASIVGLASALYRIESGNLDGAIEVTTRVRNLLIAHGKMIVDEAIKMENVNE